MTVSQVLTALHHAGVCNAVDSERAAPWLACEIFSAPPLGGAWLAVGIDDSARIMIIDAATDAAALAALVERRAQGRLLSPVLCLCAQAAPLRESLHRKARAVGVVIVNTPLARAAAWFRTRCALLQLRSHAEFGTAVMIHGQGVLLSGDAGVGKSAIAHALLAAGHRLVADDAPRLARRGAALFAQCEPGWEGRLAVRGEKLRDVRADFSPTAVAARARLVLIIHLLRYPPGASGAPARAEYWQSLCGVRLPAVAWTASSDAAADALELTGWVGRIIPQVA